MNKPSMVLTRKGEQKLKDELNQLRSVTRREVAEKIKFLSSYIIDATIYLVYDTSIGYILDYIVTENFMPLN